MATTSDILFEYVRDLLYNPGQACLDTAKLDPEYQKLGEGLKFFGQCLEQERHLAANLAKGNLSVKLPPSDNPLAAQLKALHASLKHLTWTSQQVAKGDYQQRVDFLGEFADAFNTMTEQLDQRQRALEDEIENSRRQQLALEQSASLLQAVTNELQQWIVVIDLEGELLFQNKTASDAFAAAPSLPANLQEALLAQGHHRAKETCQCELELTLQTDGELHYFSVVSYPMQWESRSAVAHVVTDISDEKRHVQQLENYAYQDNLTGLSNRYFGMQTLREWLGDGLAFSICFVDLDNLKFVNDNFGHAEGDIYIIEAAHLLEGCSPGAVVCRLGGDEFMVLSPGLSGPELEEIMAGLRAKMIDNGKAEKRPYLCSMSYGVVQVSAGSKVSSGELLSQADERMYQFKRKHKMGRGKTLA